MRNNESYGVTPLLISTMFTAVTLALCFRGKYIISVVRVSYIFAYLHMLQWEVVQDCVFFYPLLDLQLASLHA